MMNEAIKNQWLTALRSGDYRQGINSCLRTHDDKFCCLGVLCDLAVKAGVLAKPERHSLHDNYEYRDTDPKRLVDGRPILNGGYPPHQVVQWAGLPNEDPEMRGEIGQSKRLALLNDSGRFDFAQLADLIEAQL